MALGGGGQAIHWAACGLMLINVLDISEQGNDGISSWVDNAFDEHYAVGQSPSNWVCSLGTRMKPNISYHHFQVILA